MYLSSFYSQHVISTKIDVSRFFRRALVCKNKKRKYTDFIDVLSQNKGAQNEEICEFPCVALMLKMWKEPSNRLVIITRNLFK
jgi:hypothetical protein